MTIETDTLKTLQAIDKHLGNAAKTTGASGGSRAAEQKAMFAELKKARTTVSVTVKGLDNLDGSARRASGSLNSLKGASVRTTAGFGTLTDTVKKTIDQFRTANTQLGKIDFTSQFDELQASIKTASQGIQRSYFAPISTSTVASASKVLGTVIESRLNPNLEKFDELIAKTVQTMTDTSSSFRNESKKSTGISAVIKKLGRAIEGPAGNTGLLQQLGRATKFLREFNKGLIGGTRSARRGPNGSGGGSGGGPTGPTGPNDSGGGGGGPGGFGGFLKNSVGGYFKGLIGGVFKKHGAQLEDSILTVINDAYQTVAARGFGGPLTGNSAILGLYKDAALAGMSLQEYAKMMDENMGAVSRSSSFAAFDKQLDVGRDSMKKFGVFGLEATNLSATMVGSAQSLGVPMSDMSGSIEAQVKVFEQLRKTTGVTAEAFETLIRELSQHEIVQKELQGLAPAERVQRMAQIAQTASWGKELGLSEIEQRKLTEALLAQRKSTVKERFEARGRVTQAFAIAGMSGDDANEARNLTSKRQKTPEEEKRLLELMGEYNRRIQARMQDDSNPGGQYVAEEMDAKLRATIAGPIADAAGSVRTAKDSGVQANKDLNKTLESADQKLGTLIGVLEGLSKNPLFSAAAFGAMWVANAALQAALTGKAVAFALRASGFLGGGGGGSGPPGDLVGPPDKRHKTIKGMAKGALRGGGLAAIVGVGSAAYDYSQADETAAKTGEDPDDLKKQAIGGGFGAAAGGALGAAIGTFLLPGIGTYIGGILGGMGGEIFGKWFAGDSDAVKAQKKQTTELKKNTDELTKANRSSMPSHVIANENLGSLSSNVLRSGQAARSITAEDIAKATATKENPNGIVADPNSLKNISLASPGQEVRSRVNPALVNNDVGETVPEAVKVANAMKPGKVGAKPSADTLLQILAVLQEQLTVENTQTELTSMLIRSFGSRLPDNQTMMNRLSN